MLTTYHLVGISALGALIILRAVVKRLTSNSISHLRGPKPDSWLVGSLPALLRPENLGDAERTWTKEYGNTLTYKGVMGKDLLMVADPKAMQYILNTSGYRFPKTKSQRIMISIAMGHGIVWADGVQHARHRKIIEPAFSVGALRTFVPLFRHTVQRLVMKWKEELSKSDRTTSVIDIVPWFHHVTLDAIGLVGFDYEFDALEQGTQSKLAEAYDNLFTDAFSGYPDEMLIWEEMLTWIPQWMVKLLLSLPNDRLRKVHSYMAIALGVAKKIVERQTAMHVMGKEGSKDMMSILIRANLAENPKEKLCEEEVLSQLTTLFLAGHETTGKALIWTIYELSRHPEYQKLVRDEIMAARRQASQRGDSELSMSDLDSMKYLLSALKETLRLYPISPMVERVSGHDDVIPLSTPITTREGKVITSVPVPANQKVVIPMVAYNRLKFLWGDDADVWRPERFMDGTIKQGPTLGLFANLGSFSSGVRGCIGYKFAILELQVMAIELLAAFEFSPPPGNVEIRAVYAGVVLPMVKGDTDNHSRLPIAVTLL